MVGVMRKLMTGYAVNFNLRYKRVGHLFQNRYKSVICQEEPYLLELVRYIHLNPIRAGLVSGLENLASYPWSGYRVLMGMEKCSWQEVEEVLGRFGRTFGEARRKLRKFMREGAGQGKRPELMGGGLIRSLGRCSFLRRHPAPLRWAAEVANAVKLSEVAFKMLLRGELSMFKIAEYATFRRRLIQ